MTRPSTPPRPRSTPRRSLLAGLSAGFAAPWLQASARSAQASDAWPTQPIRIVVPFPAGSTGDTAARTLGPILTARLGQPVVVDNRAGAGGGVGAQTVAAARPDGHTILLTHSALLTMVPRIAQVRFDPTTDFASVAQFGDAFNLLAAAPALPFTDLAGLADHARARPEALVYASPGIGSYGHVAGELLQRLLGIRLLHVPYAGIVPATNAVLGGEAHLVMGPNVMPLVQAGSLRGIVTVAPDRWEAVPDIPTLSEAGITDWPLSFWYGLVVPAATPLPIRQRLHATIGAALEDPTFRSVLHRTGIEPRPASLEATDARIRTDWSAVGAVLERVGVRAG